MRVGLLWHCLRHPNLGVDALTRANLGIIEAAARRIGRKVEFVILGQIFVPGRDKELPTATIGASPSLKDLVRGRSTFWSDVGSCDIVFDISEGDSFTDIYGIRRFVQQVISKLVVVARGVPLILAPQTIGPFDRAWTSWTAARVIRASHKAYSRDNLSTEILKRLVGTTNVDEFVDVAFRLPYQRPRRNEDGKIRVGINVSALLYHGGYTGHNELGLTLDYKQLTNRLLAYFGGRDDVELVFVPHVLALSLGDNEAVEDLPEEASASEDDRVVSRHLAARFPGSSVAPRFQSATEAKSFISGLDFLVAGRMHACIGAMSSGVAVVPIAYSRKFIGLFGGLGYSWSIDARKRSTDEAERLVLDAFDRIDQLKAEAAASTTDALERLDRYESAVAEILSLLPPR